ncbi:MAG: GTP-binding protein, partial [Treponema sp.]|nr:GTP-binding protein [Treponema sp.]
KLKDVAGTAYQAKVAILCDYENEWDGENDIWHGPLREKSMDSWFVALQKAHIPFDYRYWEDGMSAADLQTYEYFIYPHATIFTKEQEEVLASEPKMRAEWDEKVGDRMVKLCIIGQKLDKKAISQELDALLD